jgi:hypothetical protein
MQSFMLGCYVRTLLAKAIPNENNQNRIIVIRDVYLSMQQYPF